MQAEFHILATRYIATMFVFMLALLCVCVAAAFSVDKDLYKSNVTIKVS